MLCVFVLAFFLPLIWADCPPGTIYESSLNKCYKFVNQPVTFLAAEQFCQGLGGHLVAVGNASENSFVSQAVTNQSTVKSYWIGANYLLAPNWSWTYNTPFVYSNWAPGQPADPSINQCGAVRNSDYFWTKEICYSRKPFVCSIDPNAGPVGSHTCPPEPTGNLTCSRRCSGGYTQSPIDCKCYNWHQEAYFLKFNDSQIFCESHNASLIKITSAAQNSWLTNWIFNQRGSPYPWIGLICPGATKDMCYWVDGSPLTCYDNFDTFTFQSGQVWDGSNPNFSLRMYEGFEMGTWYRCNPNNVVCTLSVVCMRDSTEWVTSSGNFIFSVFLLLLCF